MSFRLQKIFCHSAYLNIGPSISRTWVHSSRRYYARSTTIGNQYRFYDAKPTYFGQTVFTATVCTATIGYLAWQYENKREGLLNWISSFMGQTSGHESIDSFQRIQRQAAYEKTADWIYTWNAPLQFKKIALMVTDKWYRLGEGQQTCLQIIGLNAVVFLLWQIPHPAMYRIMNTHFTHSPLSGKSYTLLTSIFSHQSLLHFSLNSIGLYSFGSLVHDCMPRQEFIALYLTSGLISSYFSHVLNLRFSNLSTLKPSLGASGALFGLLGYTASVFPEVQVGVIFLPGVAVSMKYAFPALVSLDLLGIARSWQVFDHYAHLAGSIFGLYYAAFGKEMLMDPMLEKVRQLKRKMAVSNVNKS